MNMMVSLDGVLKRMRGRKDQVFMVDEFLKHYWMAKNAHATGDNKMVSDFFDLYVVSDRCKPQD